MSPSRLSSLLAVSAALCLAAACSKNATKAEPTAQQSPPGPAASEQVPPTQPGEQPPARAELEQDCPMRVPGAQARAQDTAEGVALVFVTSEEEQVAALRERSRRMMQRQQEHGTSGRRGMDQPPGIEYQGMGGSGIQGSAGSPSVPSRARLEEIPQGIAIIYTATNASQQDRLSSEIHENATKLTPGQCPGMALP